MLVIGESVSDGFVLIFWVGVLTLQAFLCVPSSADDEEVHGCSNSQQSMPTAQDKGHEKTVAPKEPICNPSHPAEHALRALPATSDYTVIPLPALAYNRNEGYWAGRAPSHLGGQHQMGLWGGLDYPF